MYAQVHRTTSRARYADRSTRTCQPLPKYQVRHDDRDFIFMCHCSVIYLVISYKCRTHFALHFGIRQFKNHDFFLLFHITPWVEMLLSKLRINFIMPRLSLCPRNQRVTDGHPRSMIFVSSERPVRRGKLSMVDGTLGIAVGPISSMSLASLMVSHLITGDEVN